MENLAEAKSARLLVIYSRLVNGEIISKSELSEQHHVSERSIQRDMESLRCFIQSRRPRSVMSARRLKRLDKLGGKTGEIADYITDKEKAELYKLKRKSNAGTKVELGSAPGSGAAERGRTGALQGPTACKAPPASPDGAG